MTEAMLTRLTSLASGPMAKWAGMPELPGSEGSPQRLAELSELLERCNGFMAFDGALHVFPAGDTAWSLELARLNAGDGWRHAYRHGCGGMVFFAANTFGELYALKDERVVRFDPETGDTNDFAPDLETWADEMLVSWQWETGHSVLRAWQDLHGPLPEGRRLMPTRLFIFGGTDALANLRDVPLLEGLAMRGDIEKQIGDLPDGSKVAIKVV